MNVQRDQADPDEARCASGIAPRLKMLVGAHLVVGTLPILGAWVPLDVRYMPLLWALASVSISQIMLLAFWAGMGTNRATVRLAAALAGIAYVAAWSTLTGVFHPDSLPQSAADWFGDYLTFIGVYGGMALMFTGTFLVMRRWWFDLRSPDELEAPRQGRFQYSLLHLLVIASLVAVVLVLVQRTRRDPVQLATPWQTLAANALGLTIFLINVVCAVRAALGAGAVALPIFLSLLTATLLGIAWAFSSGHDRLMPWWVFVGSVLVLVLPTAIVVASLLVVRSCGYRLMPKHRMTRGHP